MPKDPEDVIYTYEEQEGAYLAGLPQRDLTQADVDWAGPALINEALGTGLYRKATRDEREQAAKDAEKAQAAEAKATKGDER